MAYNMKDNRGMITDPISFRDATGLNAENIAACMKEKAEEQGVPANIRTDVVKEGGLFGKSYPCVIIHHPNPPQQYFTDVYIINNNTVNFSFLEIQKLILLLTKQMPEKIQSGVHLLIVLQDQRKWNFKKRCFGINKYMIYLNHYSLNFIKRSV
ncbi:hypothetical protein [Faecalicatena fissicatena]|uniref:Nudix hydrolase domain-containing protein n=1 Tax=Faecalicatena fissicatena TaxID=290055 RepID=A0ABS2ECD8_9FIRM|nr:hypothetical protein [Faecalicatena fissicatena]MBM6739310.1 hypothetical protein [Faecalicatena fissicatena]